MIVKVYEKGQLKLYMTQDFKGLYNIVRKVEGREPDFQSGFLYEEADEIFDFYLDLSNNNDKMELK